VRITRAQAEGDAASEPQFDALPGPAANDEPLRYGASFRGESR
jgi:hypothetical protein